MSKPNSLALISTAYPPYSFGGIDTQTYDLAHYLSKQGIQVTVICGGARKPTLTRENENLTLYRLPTLDVPPRVVWFQVQNFHRILKQLPNFDVVHTQHSSGTICGLVKNQLGRPWVVSFHDHHFRRLLTYLSLKPWKLSLGDSFYYALGYPIFDALTRVEKRADHYIMCGAAGLADYMSFSKFDSAKITLIENGIDLEKISSITENDNYAQTGHSSDEQTLFTCGRLYATKGIEYLISAMPLVLSQFKKARLKIFGKGPLEATLRKLIASLHLEESVTLEGYVPYQRLVQEMNQSDLAVFPTSVEVGASIAIMESMACRKAVVAFDYPFTREVIEHSKTGYLVPRKNVSELAKAICLLLQDDLLRLKIGENAYNYIVSSHDYRKIVPQYLKVYSNLL